MDLVLGPHWLRIRKKGIVVARRRHGQARYTALREKENEIGTTGGWGVRSLL
jgi:hypothetical protein